MGVSHPHDSFRQDLQIFGANPAIPLWNSSSGQYNFFFYLFIYIIIIYLKLFVSQSRHTKIFEKVCFYETLLYFWLKMYSNIFHIFNLPYLHYKAIFPCYYKLKTYFLFKKFQKVCFYETLTYLRPLKRCFNILNLSYLL